VGTEAAKDSEFIDDLFATMCRYRKQYLMTGETNMFAEE